MAEIEDLNTTDSSNTGRFPENQAPSTLNNGARGLEGMLARGFGDTIHSALVSTGTNTVTVTTKRTISEWGAGHGVRFFAGGTNTGDVTFNGVAVKHVDGSELRPGAITAGGVYTVAHNGTNFVLEASPASSVPDVSSTDLDDLIGTGAYTGATLTNAPTALGTERAYIEVIQGATDDTHITQRLTTMVADPVETYVRQKIADTWGDWVGSNSSPAFSGNPTAPTQDEGDNSTKLSTTEYVERAIAASASYGRWAYTEPSGTNGPNYTSGSWQPVLLNTEVYDPDDMGALNTSNGKITLEAGTYELMGTHSGIRSSSSGTQFRTRIHDITNDTTLLTGGVSAEGGNQGGGNGNLIDGVLFLTETTVIQMQLWAKAGLANSSAISTGQDEVFSTMTLKKTS